MEGSTVLGSFYGCRPRNVTQSKYVIFIIMPMYYMCPGGGKRFVPAGSRPRNLCASTPFVPFSVPCWGVPQTPKAV